MKYAHENLLILAVMIIMAVGVVMLLQTITTQTVVNTIRQLYEIGGF